MKEKSCTLCGAVMLCGRGNKKYCENCKKQLRRARDFEQRERKKIARRYQIHGNSEGLSRDVHEAIMRGISYGKYMAMKKDPIARAYHAILTTD